ncbi:hypothetical protein, partial [Pseudomonas paraveronii]|uniref:hypothetical protein n=1 Tax=Pseudomonas paraveronii TaxID=3040598 RepID=UPI002AB1F760
HEACGLAFEFSGKRTTLFGHQTPLSGEHSRLNGCPVSLDHYINVKEDDQWVMLDRHSIKQQGSETLFWGGV